MKKYYASRSSRIWAYRRIADSPLPSVVKKKVKAIYTKLFFAKKIHTGEGVMQFGEVGLAYPNYNVLAYLFSEIFLDSIYFFETKSQNPRIIDLGANIGLTTIFFKMLYPAAEITAIEASPGTFSYLEKNTGDLDGIELINKAASDKIGNVEFFSVRNELGDGQNSVFRMDNYHNASEQVPTFLLSEIITENLDLLKIDIEGGELAVFRDLKAHNSLKYVDKIIMEYHHRQCGVEGLNFILETLEESGFQYSFADCQDAPAWDEPMNTMMIYAQKK